MKGKGFTVFLCVGFLVTMAVTFNEGCGQGPRQDNEDNIPIVADGERLVTDNGRDLIRERVATTMSIGIRVLMIGNQADLESIDDEEMAGIVDLVKEMIRENGFALKDENENSDVRKTLCADINTALNRGVVNDVRFSRFTIEDQEPMLD